MTDLLFLQLTDLFRIGLIVALVLTMRRTAAVTGRFVPLALGVVFVAVLLPSTMSSATVSLTNAILVGLVSNTILLIFVLALARLFDRFRT